MHKNNKIRIAISVLLIAAAMLVLTCCVRQSGGHESETYGEHGGRETLFEAPETQASTKPVTTAPVRDTETDPDDTEPPMTEPPVTDAATTPPVTQAPSDPSETVYGGFSGLY